MFTPHVNAVFIGSSVLYELFFLHPLAQSSILEQLCDRMIRNANPLPSILLLRRLVDKQPAAFAPHREKLLACIDHLINLPPDIALLFIRSIVRLLHTPSPHGDADETVRSRLLMVLKKLLFSAAPQARVLACDGVVVLIEAVLKGQLTGSGGDEGVGSLSQSSSQSSGPAVDLPLLMELLSLLRKVMSSSAGIKQLLYARLTALYASYSFSRQHILDLLLPSFRFIQTDAAVRIPFQLNLCVYQGVITEPLPELMLTIVQALCVSLSSVANPTAHQQLRSTFRHVIARMSTLTCKDMGFNPKAGIAADSDVTRLVLLHGLYQACMEYALCENLRGLDQVLDAAGVPRKEAKVKEEVSEEGWRTLKELFQRFSPLDNHLAGRKEKDEDGAGKKKKSTAAKKKRTQEEDSSSSVEESDDDGDGGEQKKGKGVKKKGGQPKGKGKEEGGVEKKKVAVSYLLSPLALNVCLRRLLMQEYREYVSQHTPLSRTASRVRAYSLTTRWCSPRLCVSPEQPTQLLLKDVELQVGSAQPRQLPSTVCVSPLPSTPLIPRSYVCGCVCVRSASCCTVWAISWSVSVWCCWSLRWSPPSASPATTSSGSSAASPATARACTRRSTSCWWTAASRRRPARRAATHRPRRCTSSHARLPSQRSSAGPSSTTCAQSSCNTTVSHTPHRTQHTWSVPGIDQSCARRCCASVCRHVQGGAEGVGRHVP